MSAALRAALIYFYLYQNSLLDKEALVFSWSVSCGFC